MFFEERSRFPDGLVHTTFVDDVATSMPTTSKEHNSANSNPSLRKPSERCDLRIVRKEQAKGCSDAISCGKVRRRFERGIGHSPSRIYHSHDKQACLVAHDAGARIHEYLKSKPSECAIHGSSPEQQS
jgi:hypothetical protein